ncbi:hypothetical protein DFH09DRAFT_1072969 [Mycena vulgaris]|nr:hypothetical protein DFH09DRAFT_1072969 [Mycena vulgaris]
MHQARTSAQRVKFGSKQRVLLTTPTTTGKFRLLETAPYSSAQPMLPAPPTDPVARSVQSGSPRLCASALLVGPSADDRATFDGVEELFDASWAEYLRKLDKDDLFDESYEEFLRNLKLDVNVDVEATECGIELRDCSLSTTTGAILSQATIPPTISTHSTVGTSSAGPNASATNQPHPRLFPPRGLDRLPTPLRGLPAKNGSTRTGTWRFQTVDGDQPPTPKGRGTIAPAKIQQRRRRWRASKSIACTTLNRALAVAREKVWGDSGGAPHFQQDWVIVQLWELRLTYVKAPPARETTEAIAAHYRRCVKFDYHFVD